jgi:hypothetical protein
MRPALPASVGTALLGALTRQIRNRVTGSAPSLRHDIIDFSTIYLIIRRPFKGGRA